ncbi:hypothetical protein VTL71DRAFT_7962 [Oculimacula yallundae]|uniref:TeaA receptor TeaR n=1 Tax=Oculimacula yallundae TaxID=86028 RepID=A0ABR4CW72_9HELO
MAAVSAPQAPSSLTPPSSSHGGQNSWNYAVPSQSENSQKPFEYSKPPPSHTNGHTLGHQSSRTDLTQRRPEFTTTRSGESGYLAPARINALNRKDSSISETGSAPDSLLDLYGNNRSGLNSIDYGDRQQTNAEEDDKEHSRWIHRDKLARIESQELQAAGIILPRARAPSKSSRREHSRDQQGNGVRSEQAQKRQRVESLPTEEEEAAESNAWDLRLPEEAAAGDQMEGYQDVSGGVKGVSRIPVLKTSPLPIPLLHLERDTPIRRTGLVEDDSIAYVKPRGRGGSNNASEDLTATPTPAKRLMSENSPTKKTPLRKGSVPANRAASAGQRPKTRSGSNQANAAGQRPTTRSGELGPSNSTNKRPEGDPPWLATMFKPDPRLPPDQQLLPTVARRLQQEQWEKEGKFGTTYDTDFRPLNDENPRSPSPALVPQVIEVEKKPEQASLDPEWPLRGPKSPALSTGRPGTAGTGSYSTMPKIHTGTPMGVGPLPSPKPPIRVQEPPEESKKGGCGCCAVM